MPCYYLSFVHLLYLTLTSPCNEGTIKEGQKEHKIVLRDSHPGVEGAAQPQRCSRGVMRSYWLPHVSWRYNLKVDCKNSAR